MQYILLQNQNIVPGQRWILRVNTLDPKQPTYIAQIREFENELQARQFLQQQTGVLVPGKLWAIVFSGAADSTKCRIGGNFQDEVAGFMEGAAQWLSLL